MIAANQTEFLCGVVLSRTLRRYFSRLEYLPCSALHWPLGRPADGCLVGDLGPADHIILATTSRAMSLLRWNVRCRVSALIYEPPMIQARWYRLLRFLGPAAFHRVFTHSAPLAGAIGNGRLVAHGGTMVHERRADSPPKSGLVSIIASRHASLPGHKLRHRIVDWARSEALELATYGTGYRQLDDKWHGHAPYRYSVVIENSRCPGYFTEKIIDSFLAWSLPIYWGDPDITSVFLPEGMLVCDSEDQIKDRMRSLSAADFAERLPALEENQRRARAYAPSMFDRAARILAEEQAGVGS